MGWTVKREIDVIPKHPGNTDLPKAQIISTWSDPTGTFIYTARCADDTASINQYSADAIAARDAWQAKNVQNAGLGIAVLTRINNTDSQVA